MMIKLMMFILALTAASCKSSSSKPAPQENQEKSPDFVPEGQTPSESDSDDQEQDDQSDPGNDSDQQVDKVTLVGEGQPFHPHDRLEIIFPEKMDQAVTASRLTLMDRHGQTLLTEQIWDADSKRLLLVPFRPLGWGEHYKINSVGGLQNQKGQALANVAFGIRTYQQLQASVTIAGQQGTGLMLAKDQFDKLILDIQLGEAVQKARLLKLGTPLTQDICAEGCGGASFSLDLLQSPLGPDVGTNLYHLEIRGDGDREALVPLYFNWGYFYPAEGSLEKAASLLLDERNGIDTLEKIFERFTNGEFSIDFPGYGPLDVNGFIKRRQIPYDSVAFEQCHSGGGFQFNYLPDLGPYCNLDNVDTLWIDGVLVNFRAKIDTYISHFEVDTTGGNARVDIRSQDGRIDLGFGTKRFKGRMNVVVRADVADALGLPGAELAHGLYHFGVNYGMSADDFSQVAAYATLGSYRNDHDVGQFSIDINRIDEFDFFKTVNYFPEDPNTNLNVHQWVEDTVSEDPVYQSHALSLPSYLDPELVEAAHKIILNKLISDTMVAQKTVLQAPVLNGFIRDMFQTMTPEVINALLKQVAKGVDLQLPQFLPAPLNDVTVNISANMDDDVRTVYNDHQRGVVGTVALKTISRLSSAEAPTVGADQNFFVANRPKEQRTAPPSPMNPAGIRDPGVLVAIDSDVMTQVGHNLWRSGAFNVTVDDEFAEKLKDTTGSDDLWELLQRLLNGKTMLGMLTQPYEVAKDHQGVPLSIGEDHRINLKFRVTHPPSLVPRPIAEGVKKQVPQLDLGMGGVVATIEAYHPEEGTTTVLAQFKVSLMTKASVSLVPYANYSDDSEFGTKAIRMLLSKDGADLDFEVEVVDTPEGNPFSFDPRHTRKVFADLIPNLLIPLLNDIGNQLPIPRLEGCGIAITELELLPTEVTSEDVRMRPHFLVKSMLSSYPFNGVCSL